ncbi:MAG: hypothetical protein ABR595_07320 [Psychroflexus sp.]
MKFKLLCIILFLMISEVFLAQSKLIFNQFLLYEHSECKYERNQYQFVYMMSSGSHDEFLEYARHGSDTVNVTISKLGKYHAHSVFKESEIFSEKPMKFQNKFQYWELDFYKKKAHDKFELTYNQDTIIGGKAYKLIKLISKKKKNASYKSYNIVVDPTDQSQKLTVPNHKVHYLLEDLRAEIRGEIFMTFYRDHNQKIYCKSSLTQKEDIQKTIQIGD